MFTGIIETVGKVKEITTEESNIHFGITSSISHELKIDQSVAHDGVCLTVTKVEGATHWLTAINETMQKSCLGDWSLGSNVNLERCMKADGRFDGHIVQGHVDTTAVVKAMEDQKGSWLFTFEHSGEGMVVEKGSICINGTSLTCFDVTEKHFSVAIIPYTFEHTNFKKLEIGASVNLEFDIIGKYIHQLLNKK